MKKISVSNIEIFYKKTMLTIEYFLQRGEKTSVLYLHGMGCSKMDFAGALECQELNGYSIAGFDFPGTGGSQYPAQVSYAMDDLVEITHQVATGLQLKTFVIVGHSMGGLVGLLYARKYAHDVAGFINVEGNLMPEDCFASRAISLQDRIQFEKKGFSKLIQDIQQSNDKAQRKYAKELKTHASPRALHDYAQSLVKYSDSGRLLEWFIDLAMPKLFIYGSANDYLSSIPLLEKQGVPLAEIPRSGHSPFFDNPQEYYKVIDQFIHKAASSI